MWFLPLCTSGAEVNLNFPALLALEDGSLFHGTSVGVPGETVGEVVFNTAMTGYQEILTDPSYYKQIIMLTYPHIGNVGANVEDEESPKIYASGLVIRDLPLTMSSWRAQDSLQDYLRENQVRVVRIGTQVSQEHDPPRLGGFALWGEGHRCHRHGEGAVPSRR